MKISSMSLAGALLFGFGSTAFAQSVPAREVYDSYPGPHTCVSVVQRAIVKMFWNTMDTLAWSAGRRIPAEANQAGAECMKRVFPKAASVRTVPDHQVAPFFFLGRASGDDTLASQAWNRALKQQKIRDDSTTVIWHLLTAYSYGLPVNLPVARRMAAWLDTLGVIGERPLLPFDSLWVSQHSDPGYLARSLLDTAAMRVELNGGRTNFAALASKKGAERVPVSNQAEELLLALFTQPRNDSAVAALKARAIEILGPDQEEQYGGAMLLLGQTFGPLHPDFWFNRPPADSAFPRRGRITLVQVVAPHFCTCEYLAASMHRLKARFGDSVDFLLLASTQGRFRGKIQLKPEEEARLLAEELRDKWKVDATLGVYTTTFVPNPAPDNRLVPQVIPEMRHFRYGSSALVVDRRGILILGGLLDISPGSEPALIRLLETQLRGGFPDPS